VLDLINYSFLFLGSFEKGENHAGHSGFRYSILGFLNSTREYLFWI